MTKGIKNENFFLIYAILDTCEMVWWYGNGAVVLLCPLDGPEWKPMKAEIARIHVEKEAKYKEAE